jgi:hypothetical protein
MSGHSADNHRHCRVHCLLHSSSGQGLPC